MKEEKLREMLCQIDEISVRKEAAQIYRQVIANFDKYQEEQLQNIRSRVNDTLFRRDFNYAVDMFLCESQQAVKWQEKWEVFLATGMLTTELKKGAVERVYIQAKQSLIEKELAKEKQYKAIIETNYETYPVTVILQPVYEVIKQVAYINELLFLNRVDLPKVNDIYVRKFYDICLVEIEDRLRPDEIIQGLKVEWEELTPYICNNITLFWNLRKMEAKESGFPKAIPVKDKIKYSHKILLPHKELGYLISHQKADMFMMSRQEETIEVMTDTKNYQNWELYEVLFGKKELVRRKMEQKEISNIMTNSVKKSVFTELQNGRNLFTQGEIYRKLMSYEMSNFFEKIELKKDREILFYPKNKEEYCNEDVMRFIIEDMSCLYGGHLFTGRLVNDEK